MTATALRPAATIPKTWQDEARCAGQTALMYTQVRDPAARALCRRCPVAEVCLWSTMITESTDEYRFGLAGGLGPSQRERLGSTLSRLDIDERLAKALNAWQASGAQAASEPTPTAIPSWSPPKVKNRPWRKCQGCKATIIQPKAGRPKVWCSKLCHQRHRNRDADAAQQRRHWAELSEAVRAARKAADAARSLQRWYELPEDHRERGRAAMRDRWANLTAEQRAELAARRRQRRRSAQSEKVAV
jgi:hypothetical protein